MEFLQQNSDTIIYLLSEEAVDLTQFKVLQQGQLSANDLTVTGGILAESHFVLLSKGQETLCEICACTDSINTKLEPIVTKRLTELPTTGVTHQFDDYIYQFSYTVEPLTQYTAFCEQFSEPKLYLEQEFPKQPHEETAGITKLWVHVGEQLVIDTLHTYPHEAQMVSTRTVLEHKRQ